MIFEHKIGEYVKYISICNEKGIKVEKKTIRKIVSGLINELKINVKYLEISFVASETLLVINKKYLHHNFRTDIITFDYSIERNNLDGEILISFADAVENSKKYRVSVENELLRLVVHGILHLIGYDDTSSTKRKKMKKVENELVQKLRINEKT